MIVDLIRPWKGYPVGRRFVDMQSGVAKILVKRGIGVIADHGTANNTSGSDHAANTGATDAPGSEEPPLPATGRQQSRRRNR
jgi:hypothetical protein